MQQRPPRPTGVTILAILALLIGIFGLFGGAVLIGLGFLLGTLAASADITNAINNAGYPGLASLGVGALSAIVIVFGVVVLLIGILYLATGIGFFGGRGWSWTLGMIVSVISLILAIVQIAFGNVGSVLSLIVSGLILYYLTRTRVKAFFGKAAWGPSTMGSSTMSASTMGTSTSTSSPPTMGAGIKCPACGAMAPAGSTKCPNCGAML